MVLIAGSPYVQEIAELTSPSVEGPGLKKGIVEEPCVFNIDARGFPGHVTVDIQGLDSSPVDISILIQITQLIV